MEILDKIKNLNTKNKYSIGVYLSQSSQLEVILYDNLSKTVLKSGRAEGIYDLSARQIDRIDIFNATIIKLLEKMEVPDKTPITISLPPVLINKQTLPLNLGESEIKMVLTSDAERNYIFKKQEPKIGWHQVKINTQEHTQDVLFSAIQAAQIDLIKEAFKNYNLVAIDANYTSLLRGLANFGIVHEEISNSENWGLAIITPLNFTAIEFNGSKITKINETAIAAKSLEQDELYQTILGYCNESINYNAIEHLIVVNELNEISVDTFTGKLDIKCKVSGIDQNKLSQPPVKKGDLTIYDTPENTFLETIGAAAWKKSSIKIGFNFLDEKIETQNGSAVTLSIAGKTFVLTTQLIEKTALVLLPVTFLSVVIVFIILSAILGSMNKTLEDISAKKLNYQAVIEKNKTQQTKQQVAPTQDLTPAVYDKNSKIMQSFLAVGEVIPEKLWIEKFNLNDDMTTTITGKAFAVDDILSYYQNLTVSGTFQNLKITSIKIVGDSDSSKNTDVTIVTPNNNAPKPQAPANSPTISNLPKLPTLPSISNIKGSISPFIGRKYYEFTFGTSAANAAGQPATPPAAANSTTPPASPPTTGAPPSAPLGAQGTPPSHAPH